jgi:predicted phage terminase large subunit-like protein
VVYADPVKGDKIERAEPFAAQWQAGNVKLVSGSWNRAYLEELRSFPNGKNDDQVDGSSGGYNKLAEPERKAEGKTIENLWQRRR